MIWGFVIYTLISGADVARGASLDLLKDRCPKGIGEETLTFSRIMRNFRFTLKAEALALKPGEERDRLVKIKEARQDLAVVQDCARLALRAAATAQSALQDSIGLDEHLVELLPRKLGELSSVERAKYLRVYIRMMQLFVRLIENVDLQLISLEQAPEGKEGLSRLNDLIEKMNHQVIGAHRTLSCADFLLTDR